jgi:hypothetical protein
MRRSPLALVLGLLGIFAVAVVAGIGGADGGAPIDAGARNNAASPEVRTAAYTVITGVFVFVLGQIAQRFFIEPIQEQKRSLGEVVFAVRYYSGTLLFGASTGPWHYKAGTQEVRKEASETLYKLSAEVRASLSTVPCYQVFERLGFVKKKETVEEVALKLQGWALYVKLGDSSAAARHRAAVAKALDIPQS